MAASNGFTPTQRRMMDLLKDGERHTRHDLLQTLGDEFLELPDMKHHLKELRRRLKDRGQLIVCELYYRQICYRLIPDPAANPLPNHV